MNINSAKLIYFSPTKTSKKVLEGIAQGLQADVIEHMDLTPPDAKAQEFAELHDELAIIGVPVYSGRVPPDAASRLKRLRANDTPAVVVVVYGNREYEDALLELKDLAVEAGFIPVAGGAFIGEHSFSNETTPIATGRPDAEDLDKARDFGTMILKKMGDIGVPGEISSLQVPGNVPYREPMKRSKISPITQEDVCTKCEQCAEVCPTGTVTVSDTVTTDQTLCILCCACVKNCPSGARVMEDPQIKKAAEWLHGNYSKRKEPEMYL